jgi:hypothetical protein
VPWFKVDDGFAFHRKAIKAGNTALGLWVRAGSWCAHQLTDGQVPSEVLPLLGGSVEDAEALVSAGFWQQIEGGYQFYGWHDYQPTKADVEEERAKARERQKEWRKNKRNAVSNAVTDSVTNAVTDTVTDAVSHRGSNAAPSLPDPSLPSSTSLTLVDGSESGEKMPRSKKATRIPDPWIIDEAMKDWAVERGMNPQWVMKHTERFVNYWRGIGGQRGTKLDWRSTWKNWLLKAQDESPATAPASRNGYAGDDVRARFK